MKKFLINNYALIVLFSFIVYNPILHDLIISGPLYLTLMAVITVLNIVAIVKLKKNIKYKTTVLIVLFIIWLIVAKNPAQYLFALSTIITLAIIDLKETKPHKIVSIIILALLVVLSYPILSFAYIICYGTDINTERSRMVLYGETVYYCEDNTEVYRYSSGAWDHMHYNVGKAYEFLNIDNVIHISYNTRHEVSKEDYDSFLDSHSCERR